MRKRREPGTPTEPGTPFETEVSRTAIKSATVVGHPVGGALSEPPIGYPLLPGKLTVPSLPLNYVVRTRLVERVNRATRFPVVVVTGVVGSGKTTLGSAWLRSGAVAGSPAWLSLDDEDNRPGVFWSYVVEAVQRLGVTLGGIPPPSAADHVDRSFLASLVNGLAAATRPVVLVLDRFDAITNREIGTLLSFVVQHAAPMLRLVVFGRDTHAFPLHRYRLSGDVIEIGNSELAFTMDETKALLDRHGLHLGQQDCAAIHARTGGWVSALRLSAMAANPVNGSRRNLPDSIPQAVTELLSTEVLDSQSPLVQELLLRVSIDVRVHPDLADRLTGRLDSETLLRDIAQANVFVEPIGSAPGWYRCHPMFREVLRAELDARRPGLAPRLHAEAATWYAERGQLADCIRHSGVIGDWNSAATQLVDAVGLATLLAGAQARQLRNLLAGMSEHPSTGPAAVVAATLALARSDPKTAECEVRRARGLVDGIDAGERSTLEIGIAFVDALLSRAHGRADTATHAAKTLEDLWPLLTPAHRARTATELRLVLLASVGATLAWAHEPTVARNTLQKVATDSRREGALAPLQDALGQIALLDLADGDLCRAETHARESLEVARQAGDCSILRTGAADAALAAVALERNALSDVAEHLAQAADADGADLDPSTVLSTTLIRARLATSRGAGSAGLDILDAGDRALRRRDGYAAAAAALAAGRATAYTVVGDRDLALRCLTDIPAGADRTLLEARAHARAGDRDTARRLLANPTPDMSTSTEILWLLLSAELAPDTNDAIRAVRLALTRGRPGGFRRAFVEAGPWLRRVLRQHPELATENPWLAADRGGDTTRRVCAGQEPLPALEVLTGRELEVLKCLSQAMSVRDIGAELYLSTNTVKTHLKSIYRKLAVTDRSDAARRARKLNLIP